MRINNTLSIAIIFMLALLIMPVQLCAQVGVTKNVLIISGFGEDAKWTGQTIDRFHKELHGYVSGNINVFAEYLDWQLLTQSEYCSSKSDLISSKYHNTSIDMAIYLGIPAYEFAKNNLADSLLMDVPFVYCYTDGNGPVFMTDYETAVPDDNHCPVSETLQIAKTFLPELTDILLISDSSVPEHFPNIKSCQIVKEYTDKLGLELEVVSDHEYSTAEMFEKVGELAANKAVVFVRWRDNEFADEYLICSNVVAFSPVPVFVVSSDLIGMGVIGGNVVSFDQIAKEAAMLAGEYLNGQMLSSGTKADSVCRNVFDLNVLLRWKISVSAIPIGSDIFEIGGESDIDVQEEDVQFTSQELQWLDESQKASVAILVRPPLVITGQPSTGYAIDYIELLAKKSGIELEFDYSYNSISDYLVAARDGRGPDIVIGMEKTIERSKYIDFSEPWLSMYYTLFVCSENDMLFYDDLNSLAGRVIAVEYGSRVHELLAERYGFIDLLPVDNAIEGLRAVSEGRAFGWLGDHSVGLYVVKSEKLNNVKVGVSLRELGKHNFSLAVRKGNPLLLSVLQKTMAQVPVEERDRIIQKYNRELSYSPGMSVKDVAEIIAMLMLIFSVLLFLISLRIRKAAGEVRESKENLRITFNSIADAVIVTGLGGKVQRINPVAAQLTGYEIEEAIGKDIHDIFDIVDPVTLKQTVSPLELIDSDKSGTGEVLAALISATGRRFYISYNASLVRAKAGAGQGMVLIFHDITSGFEMERRMKRAEKERELILDNITVGVCYYDEHFFPIRYNKQMEKYYNELIGTSLDKVKDELNNDNGDNGGMVRSIKKFNISKSDSENKDGYELEVTAIPVTEGDRVKGVLEVVVDVTEYRKLQNELESAYEKLSSYSGELEEMVRQQTSILEDRNMQLSTALEDLKNAQGKLILSVKMAALGQLITGIAHEITTPLGVIGASEGIIVRSMVHLVSNIVAVDNILTGENASLVNSLLSQGIVHRRSEITLSTRQERNLRSQLSGQLQEAGLTENIDYIASFLIGSGAVDNWRDYLPVLQQKNHLDVLYELANIFNICTSCKTVIDSVAKASRIVTALKSYVHKNNYDINERENVVFDLVPGLENVFILFSSRFRQNINLKIEISQVPVVHGMPDELNQVWTNIIQNAIEAMPDGGELKVTVKPQDGGVMVSMADTGSGMSQETKARIFEPHFSTRATWAGAGLGMDIVKRIVEDNYNGRVTVESEVGKGTTVNVWLPAA